MRSTAFPPQFYLWARLAHACLARNKRERSIPDADFGAGGRSAPAEWRGTKVESRALHP